MQNHGRVTAALSCVGLLSFAAVELRAQETAPLLTLQEAVLVALANNERMLSSRETIEQAQLGRTLAESAFGTRITPNILGSFGQSDVRNQTYGLGASETLHDRNGGPDGRRGLDVPQPDRQLLCGRYDAARQSVAAPGPRTGRGAAADRASRLSDRGSTERQYLLAEQQLAIDVAGTYYRLIAQRELAVAARTALESARQLLAASEAKLQANLVSQLDVFRARQLVAEAEAQLFDVEGVAET